MGGAQQGQGQGDAHQVGGQAAAGKGKAALLMGFAFVLVRDEQADTYDRNDLVDNNGDKYDEIQTDSSSLLSSLFFALFLRAGSPDALRDTSGTWGCVQS